MRLIDREVRFDELQFLKRRGFLDSLPHTLGDIVAAKIDRRYESDFRSPVKDTYRDVRAAEKKLRLVMGFYVFEDLLQLAHLNGVGFIEEFLR